MKRFRRRRALFLCTKETATTTVSQVLQTDDLFTIPTVDGPGLQPHTRIHTRFTYPIATCFHATHPSLFCRASRLELTCNHLIVIVIHVSITAQQTHNYVKYFKKVHHTLVYRACNFEITYNFLLLPQGLI